MILRTVALGASLCLLSAGLPAAAQEFGCFSSDRFDVEAIEQTDDAGSIFAVKVHAPGAPSTCPVTESTADFVVGTPGDPLWFAALTGRHLVMTRSTGPQGDVVIFDLDRREYVLDVPADEMEPDATGVTYWERVEEGTRSTCPEFAEYEKDGLSAAIVAESRFDFASGATRRTGQRLCVATQ